MCEFSEYGFQAEWGDYIRRHASDLVKITGMTRGVAIATVKMHISTGHAPDDLAERIINKLREVERGYGDY